MRRLTRAYVVLNSRTVITNNPGSKMGSRARAGILCSQIVESPETRHSCRAATPRAPCRRQKLAGVHMAISGGCPVADSTDVRTSSSTGRPRGTTSLVESNPTVAWTKTCESEAKPCAGVRRKTAETVSCLSRSDGASSCRPIPNAGVALRAASTNNGTTLRMNGTTAIAGQKVRTVPVRSRAGRDLVAGSPAP